MMTETVFWSNEIPGKYLNRKAIPHQPGCPQAQSICFECERSMRGSCPWRERFEPYPGWTAEKTALKCGGTVTTVSYNVRACPGFVASRELITIVTKRKRWDKKQSLIVRRIRLKPEHLDTDACMELMRVALRVARRDYILDPHKGRRKQIEEWIRTLPFVSNPDAIIEELRETAEICDKNIALKSAFCRRDSHEDAFNEAQRRNTRSKKKRHHSAKWRVFNIGTEYEFGECSGCGYETETYPRVCPGCRALMASKEVVKND